MPSLQVDDAELASFAAAALAAARELADLEAANAQAGRVVVQAARPPVATGALASGMFATPTAEGVTWASTVRYWTFVHWGAPRRNLRARPFFVEALDADTDTILAIYAEHANETLRRNLT